MGDIQNVTIAIGRNTDTTDIAIGHGIHLLAFHALRLDVETSMNVVGTNLAKGGREINRDVERVAVFRKVLSEGTENDRQRHENQKRTQFHHH